MGDSNHNMDDVESALADVYDAAVRCIRSVLQVSGRSPDDALLAAISLTVSLLNHGGPGWEERLSLSQTKERAIAPAFLTLQETDIFSMDERDRGDLIAAWLAEHDAAAYEVLLRMQLQ